MNRYRNHLVLILAAVAASACTGLESPPPPAVPVEELVRQSPCDILPEGRPVVGQLAGPHGYPRWNGSVIVRDPSGVNRSPDANVIHNLTGGPTFENEVHDCQRLVLVTGSALAFGPLVGLLPLDGAMALTDLDFSGGVAAATVYNWGDFHGKPEAYAPLGIDPGRNCLWLRRDTETSWRAALVALPTGPCSTQSRPATSAYTLDVQRALHAGPMPRTARWEWDEADATHVMGIKCGSAWCRVGRAALWQADTVHLAGNAQATIPGYFDEQHLAVPDGSGGIIPGPVGVLTPTATFFTLAQNQANSPTDVMGPAFATGLEVATLTLADATATTPPTYEAKWGLRQGPITLHLQIVPGGVERSTFTGPTGSQGHSVTPVRIPNTLHASVGSVRWRWHDTATTASIWSACGVKGMDCCDTQ